jgi:integrase
MRGVYEKVKGSKDFYIRYTDDQGRRHRQHVGRYSAAVEALVNKRREVREGKFIAPVERKNNSTLEDLFDKRMADLKRTLSRKTYDHHKSDFNHPLLVSLKKKPARTIRAQDIEAVLSGLHEDGRSDATIRNYRAGMSAVFAYAIKRKYVDSNPVKETLEPKPAKERVRFLSKDEEESIRKKIGELFPEREAELDLLLHTGMRSGEAYWLTWDRVDLERGVIGVPLKGKTGWRDIPINSICRKALEKLHEQSRGSEFVIPRGGKQQNYALTKWFGDAVEKAGVLHATPHTMRHTFASRLVMAGVSLRQVQEFMGHASIVMTMKYAHLSPERGQADIEKLVTAAAPATAQAKPPVRAVKAKPAGMVKVA